MDHNVIAASQHFDAIEHASEAACYAAAQNAGVSLEAANLCEDGEYCCPECPWKETSGRWKHNAQVKAAINSESGLPEKEVDVATYDTRGGSPQSNPMCDDQEICPLCDEIASKCVCEQADEPENACFLCGRDLGVTAAQVCIKCL